MENPNRIALPLPLARGAEVKNRIFKSAMSEQLGDKDHNPGKELAKLYRAWADGGVGIAVTGNVMVDRGALGEPKNVVLDEESDMERFTAWADAGRVNGTHLWMQLNHPGKQSPKFLSAAPVAPSAVPLDVGIDSVFNLPRELTDEEILIIIDRFARGAGLARKAGFTGVQIHCAHGYLLSQFLSPRHNCRTDRWGGSLENRMRVLVEVYRAIRKEVGESFPVGLKLNSADFSKGGFTFEDSMRVAKTMEQEGIDLIEISGGTYESPNMTGHGSRPGAKEAYFIEYAEKVRVEVSAPLVVTGGFRSGGAMEDALAAGVTDMIGVARPLAVDPDFPNKLLADPTCSCKLTRPTTGVAFLDQVAMLDITWYESQLYRIGTGKKANPNLSAWSAVMQAFWRMGAHAFKQRRAKA